MTTCPICGHTPLVRKTEPTTYQYKGQSVTVDQPGNYCGNCGESFLNRKDMRATDAALRWLKAAGDGENPPGGVKFVGVPEMNEQIREHGESLKEIALQTLAKASDPVAE